MKAVNIADEIYRELESPSTISISSIVFWLGSNIGKLNDLLDLSIEYETSSEEFSPDLSEAEKSILKQLYFVHYWTRRVDANLGAAGYDTSVLEVTEDDRTVRLVNKNEVAKSYIMLKRDAAADLMALVTAYKLNNSKPCAVLVDTHLDVE